jgi:threonyl-tRNA synthetase
VAILPIAEKNFKYAKELGERLALKGIRAEVGEANETLSAKIRRSQLQKIPYMAIVGDKEEKSQSVALRLRTGEDVGEVPVEKFAKRVDDNIRAKKLDL